jgi:hypothetical protein
MELWNGMPILDDENCKGANKDYWFVPTVEGQMKAHGLVPRQLSTHPPEMFDPPSDLKVFTTAELAERVREMEESKTTIRDVLTRMAVPPKDQNGHGYCWAYSIVACIQAMRALDGLPYVDLSAHAVAAIIKRGKDEGGWCGLSAKFCREVGVPPASMWREHSRDIGQDTPALRAEAAKNRVTEEWVDLTRNVYDQNLTLAQVYSCYATRTPCAVDFNHWSHSVMGCGAVMVEAGSVGHLIRNSWGNWGDNGYGVLRGSKAIPNGAVAVRRVTVA